MRKRGYFMRLAMVGATLMLPILCSSISAQEEQTSTNVPQDDPAAHALYDKMIETMRGAQTLSYESDYRWESDGRELGRCTYTIWMMKPNYFRLETMIRTNEKGGILIGDGINLWIYWPNKRPQFSVEEDEAYQKTSRDVFLQERTPVGRHSIAHKTSLLGAGMSMTIIDPSTFHGYTDSLQSYVDGVTSMGTETVGEEECDVIEVSIMKHQRSWYLWLSKRDHLPRKLKEVVRVSHDIVVHEQWSKISINAEIPLDKFKWMPPDGWTQWFLPEAAERLLKPGEEAPDFDLIAADGSRIKLSDYRGKIVWLYIWRAG
ncbi:MAG: DUF2092 domain-containing protein [bacterium]